MPVPVRLRRHVLRVAAAACVIGVGAGPWVLGSRSDASLPAAPGAVAGTSCVETSLRFGVTNDPRVRRAQDRFERDPAATAVPNPGFYEAPLDPTASLHAAAHGLITMYRRSDAAPAAVEAVAAIHARAQESQVPIVSAPRNQAAALVVIRDGAQLSCADAGAPDLTAAWRFAAAPYASSAP